MTDWSSKSDKVVTDASVIYIFRPEMQVLPMKAATRSGRGLVRFGSLGDDASMALTPRRQNQADPIETICRDENGLDCRRVPAAQAVTLLAFLPRAIRKRSK